MKKNTSCGCGGHKGCPPMKACDTAKSHSHFCDVGNVQNEGDTEITVILGDVPIQTLAEAEIKLPTYANDIKHIRKNVFLTQCEAIPVILPSGDASETRVKLFLEGYVHKNIQYVEDCDGCVKDYSVNVPFKCFTLVEGLEDVAFAGFSTKSNQVNEIREIAHDGMGSDRCSFGSFTSEVFNEPIKCKLLSADITQMDFPHNFDNWGRFNKITEKLDINLVIRLTQKQRD